MLTTTRKTLEKKKNLLKYVSCAATTIKRMFHNRSFIPPRATRTPSQLNPISQCSGEKLYLRVRRISQKRFHELNSRYLALKSSLNPLFPTSWRNPRLHCFALWNRTKPVVRVLDPLAHAQIEKFPIPRWKFGPNNWSTVNRNGQFFYDG